MLHEHNHLPCLQCHPHSYIRMVQHLIEKCLILHMSQEECINALDKHASIQPIVTVTVWKELLKENKEFFHSYYNERLPRHFHRRDVPRETRFRRTI